MPLTVHHIQRGQSERIVWLCEELGLDYDLKLYQRSPLLSPPELAKLTPLGAAPVIDDEADGKPVRLAETMAVAEYLLTKYGGGRLRLAPEHKNYTDFLYWYHLGNGNLQPAISLGFRLGMLKLPKDNKVQQMTDGRAARLLNHYNDRLKETTWLAGDDFTAADIMTVFSLTTMRLFNQYSLAEYPAIVAYLKRVGERPGYQKAMAKSDPGLEPLLGAAAPEPFPALL